MDTTAILAQGGGSSRQAAAAADSNAKAFRQADFLAIMLAEVSNQDPFEPMETSKLVENMQKLQELANTTFTEFRNNMRWAQDLVGREVTVGQVPLREDELKPLRDRGLTPDAGFGTVKGRVDDYLVIDEKIWLTIKGKHYRVDDVQRMEAEKQQIGQTNLASAANFLGFTVSYLNTVDGKGGPGSGQVTSVESDKDGNVILKVGDKSVSFDQVRRIGVK